MRPTQNQQSNEASALTVFLWILVSLTLPLLGTALIWLFATRLKQSQKWIFTIANMVSLLTLMIAAQPPSGTNQSLSSSSDAGSPESPAAVRTEAIPPGTWGNVRDDRAVQVSRMEVVSRVAANSWFSSPIQPKGGQLIIVYMSIKNTGNESGTMSWSGFQLVDAQGRKYDEVCEFRKL